MLAVLDDAFETLFSGPNRRPKIWADAVAWFLSEDPKWPFSFVNICDALDLDASRLRQRIAPWLGSSLMRTAMTLRVGVRGRLSQQVGCR
jgi:hypothetical protein